MALDRTIIHRTLATKEGEAAYGIVERLCDAGHDAWWVGGAPRDMLRGSVPEDIDIATDAKPEQVMALFPKHDDAGARFGSIMVSMRGAACEVTTFRMDDAASDGRHPEAVVFGSREDDPPRRDFTVNALYWHPISMELWDPTGGEADLRERLIRFIGNPPERIRHDALRILRAVRFRALLNGQYHPETYQALLRHAGLTAELSGQRVSLELERMLLGPHPDRAFEDLWELRVLEYVLPELHACKGVAQPADYHHEGDVWDHTLQCIRSFSSDHGADVRWAALFHDSGKARTFHLQERIRFDGHATASADIAREALSRFQFPARRREKIAWLIRHHMMMGAFAEMPEERKAHWYYHPWFLELLQLMWIDIAGTSPGDFDLYESIVSDYNRFLDAHPRPQKPLLSGEEIMEILGIGPGEEVGKVMKLLHEAQIRKEVTTKKEAREFLAAQRLRSSHPPDSATQGGRGEDRRGTGTPGVR